MTTVFDGLTPMVRINAFIDASEDEKSSKASDLETQIMREIVEKLEPEEEEEEEEDEISKDDIATVNNIISAATLTTGVAELQKLIALASKTIATAREAANENSAGEEEILHEEADEVDESSAE